MCIRDSSSGEDSGMTTDDVTASGSDGGDEPVSTATTTTTTTTTAAPTTVFKVYHLCFWPHQSHIAKIERNRQKSLHFTNFTQLPNQEGVMFSVMFVCSHQVLS